MWLNFIVIALLSFMLLSLREWNLTFSARSNKGDDKHYYKINLICINTKRFKSLMLFPGTRYLPCHLSV